MATIKVGIVGYGNLGIGVEKAIKQNSDLSLEAIFTRRQPEQMSSGSGAQFLHISAIEQYIGKIDVMILCGGSATDLPEQTPAIVPEGKEYTFWGKGVSQGHSDAIRRIPGVKNGVQYTIPVQSVIDRIHSGETPVLSTREKHHRQCFVVAQEGADQNEIRQHILTMPNYFADYDTTVTFISEDELHAEHQGMPHGGFVIRSGVTGEGTKQIIEFGLKLGSNPEFTGSVLVAYARAAYRLHKEGHSGARTVLDIPLGHLSPKSPDTLRRDLL